MPLLALPPSADGRAVTGGAAVLRNHSTSSVTRDSTSFTSFSSTSSSSSSSVPAAAAYSSRCRRHRTDRRRLAAVLLTVVLLVAQASVAGGLAADADRKSRRKPSPPVVESSFGAEVDRGGGDVADTSIGKRLAAGNGRNGDGGDPSTWRNSSSSHAVNAATMATTAVSTTSTARWNDEDRFVNPKPADLTIECKQLRSKRYISDGFCTSVKPVVDVVCTGSCLPIRQLPWYAEFIKVWSHAKTLQYRCVDDDVRRRDVLFACDNGETRSYKIRVVRSCKCKRYVHNQNESPASSSSSRKKKKNRKSRRSASAKRRNAAYGEDDNDEDDPETPAMRGRWSDDESNDRRDGDDN